MAKHICLLQLGTDTNCRCTTVARIYHVLYHLTAYASSRQLRAWTHAMYICEDVA
jgi:hypothetical protein